MSLSEDNTFNKIKSGNLKTFEKVFREFYPVLCSFANKFLSDADKSEEIVQEIFYKIWKKRESLDINVSLKSYLYKSVQNKCYQIIQHKAVEDKYKNYVINDKSNHSILPSDELEIEEINLLIEQTLNSLPDRCNQIFRMNRFEGLKYKEIADKLSISIKTVEANMGKALKAFRSNFKKYNEVYN
ncbi:MAG: RNA polymerase sigma-70 factor [Bacteroidales bacterium]|nr:RNA polymerase sigma-70 factor [Bacteroidales bacterium]MBN2756200.1 RNA polymerase sigma-70 factor [Bacteroidales bacterium]